MTAMVMRTPWLGSFRTKIWFFAAAVALCSHVAFGMFVISQLNDDADDDELGAPGIEIAFELASPRQQPTDLPPGPESEASAASQAAAQQRTAKAPDLEEDKVKDAEDPDRQVVTKKSDTKSEDEPEKKKSDASQQSVAQQASAAPSVPDAVAAPKSTTIDQGTGQARYRARVTWQKELLAHLNKFKHYPDNRSQQSAEIVVRMTLDRSGHVVAADIAKSSGDMVFDTAAIAMVEKADPVPAPPPLIADEGLVFSLPVLFKKNKH